MKYYFEFYDAGWIGLKHDWFGHAVHGVPEGTPDQWKEVFEALRTGTEYNSKRLAVSGDGIITSPRNTNDIVTEGFLFTAADVDELERRFNNDDR